MDNKFFISIIINCFNGEKFLEESISSVINQSYSNWELIFWDNQSFDQSAQIVKRFRHPKIRYFLAPKHTCLGEARFLALSKSKGQWIAFLDCDDYWDKDKLKFQVNAIKAYKGNVGFVYSNTQLFSDVIKNNRTIRISAIKPGNKEKLPQGNISKYLFIGNFVPFTSILYKRKAIIEAGNFSKFKHCPDYYLNLSISIKYDVLGVNRILCFYRIHDYNLSNFIEEIGILESIEIVNLLSKKNKLKNILKVHQIRNLIYLLKNNRFRKIIDLLKEMNILNIIHGIIAIIKYRRRFKTKL